MFVGVGQSKLSVIVPWLLVNLLETLTPVQNEAEGRRLKQKIRPLLQLFMRVAPSNVVTGKQYQPQTLNRGTLTKNAPSLFIRRVNV